MIPGINIDKPRTSLDFLQSQFINDAYTSFNSKNELKIFLENMLKYVDEKYDENGILKSYKVNCPDDFSFAYDIMDEIAAHETQKRAMLWTNDKGEERTFTFGEFKTLSDKAANLIASKGFTKGDKLMVILKRHYEFWIIALACHKLGVILIPGTNLLTKKDLIYRFNTAEVKGIICTGEGDISAFVDEAIGECPTVVLKLIVKGTRDGWPSFTDEMDKMSEKFERIAIKKTDPLLLYFTSGTTGMPKMVMHDNSYPLGHIMTAKHWHNVVPDGLHLTISETGWAKSVWGKLYGQWIMEAGIFVYDHAKFEPAVMLNMINKYKITTFCAPPTMFRFFIKENLENFDLSCLTHTTIAGEALNPEVFNQFYKHTGLKLMEGFGQTETTVMIANTTNMEPRPGSMGKPVPQYDIIIADDNGEDVAPGVTGEICIRTGKEIPIGLFMGYYKDETLTNSVWHDGLYHTGDTAWKDEDGYFWYVGRLDDIIKSSGYRIGPFEIESVLMEHPSVLECAITGVPDEVRGQVVKATIVLAKGYVASDELLLEIQKHVKNLTAPYKYPRIIEFVSELPKTISGKVRRVEIREKG